MLGGPGDVRFDRKATTWRTHRSLAALTEIENEQTTRRRRFALVNVDALLHGRPSGRSLRAPLVAIGAGLLLVVAAAITSRIWIPGFILVGIALVGLLAYAAVLWPRVVIVLVVLSPILDRYVVSGILPDGLDAMTNSFSEGLLLGVSLILAARAWRDGRLVEAFRHPSTLAFIAFIALAILSALLNGVPPQVAIIGLVFTLDAAACFYLPRLVGFSLRQAVAAVGIVVGLVAVGALISLAQALLSPTLLGLSPVSGRFGEVYRLASVFNDPNVFGAFLIAATPFALLATRLGPPRRWLALAITFLVVLALWLSFSRGSWLALVVGVGLLIAILDRRALLVGIAVVVVSFATAVVMPRDLLLPRAGTGPGEQDDRPQLIDSTWDRVGTIGRGEDLRTLFVLNAIPILGDHPLLGVGPGRYGGAAAHNYRTPIYAEYGTDDLFLDPTQATVDNFWLHLVVEAGALGLAAFLAAAVIPGLRILWNARAAFGWRRILLGGIAAAAAGLAISSVSTMLLEANSVAFLFWFLLGVGSLLLREPAAAAPLAPNGADPVSSGA